jgi:tRNA(adenine34) deaminase
MAAHTHRSPAKRSSRSGKKSIPAKKKSAPKKTRSVKSASTKLWVRKVTTDSTHPPKDLFTKSAPVIARSLASKKVSPKGPGSGMRMLTYFLNRGGKGLSATRRRELERAKKLLHERIEKEKQKAA